MAYHQLYDKAKSLLTSKQLDDSHQLLTEIIDQFSGEKDSSTQLHSSECLPTDHDMANIYNTRGHIKYLWVDFDGAILDYTQAIHYDPQFAIPYYNRGQIHYRMGRYKQAEVDLLEAVRLQPNFPDAVYNLQQVQQDIATGRTFNKEIETRT